MLRRKNERVFWSAMILVIVWLMSFMLHQVSLGGTALLNASELEGNLYISWHVILNFLLSYAAGASLTLWAAGQLLVFDVERLTKPLVWVCWMIAISHLIGAIGYAGYLFNPGLSQAEFVATIVHYYALLGLGISEILIFIFYGLGNVGTFNRFGTMVRVFRHRLVYSSNISKS